MRVKLTVLIMLLVLYPTAEFTRLIAAYDPFGIDLAFELVFIWLGYLAAGSLTYHFMRRT